MNKDFKLKQFHKFETLIFKIENLKHVEKLVCITYKTYKTYTRRQKRSTSIIRENKQSLILGILFIEYIH